MGKVRPFSLREYDLAMRLSRDTRIAYKSHLVSQRELRDKFDHIRSIIHHPPMTNEHFKWLLESLNYENRE